MFICNFKLNLKKILIACIIIAIAIVLLIEGTKFIKSTSINNFDYVLTEENFTDYLKSIHDDIPNNIGKTIKLSGFVFTLPDFKINNFVCGRNMILDNEEKVVGFLCEYEKTSELLENEWVEITGTIIHGYYMTDMPVIKIESLKKITAPANTYVNPPKDLV
ncbi:MAG: hypothetical protein IKV94_04690 [Clostridia bacterium]|nr:hypothetical protein [Clostridia bacterium]